MQRSRAEFFDDRAMLLIEPKLQSLFAVGVDREEIEIVVGSAVQDAAVEINGGVNESVGGAAILRLDVVGRLARFHVGVMTEQHGFARFASRLVRRPARRNLHARFDRPAVKSLL